MIKLLYHCVGLPAGDYPLYHNANPKQLHLTWGYYPKSSEMTTSLSDRGVSLQHCPSSCIPPRGPTVPFITTCRHPTSSNRIQLPWCGQCLDENCSSSEIHSTLLLPPVWHSMHLALPSCGLDMSRLPFTLRHCRVSQHRQLLEAQHIWDDPSLHDRFNASLHNNSSCIFKNEWDNNQIEELHVLKTITQYSIKKKKSFGKKKQLALTHSCLKKSGQSRMER